MDPFRFATWCIGMTLGVPMLAAELASEIWGPKSASATIPTSAPASDLRTAFATQGIEDLRDEIVAAQGAKLALSEDPLTRITGERMVVKVAAKRARKARS